VLTRSLLYSQNDLFTHLLRRYDNFEYEHCKLLDIDIPELLYDLYLESGMADADDDDDHVTVYSTDDASLMEVESGANMYVVYGLIIVLGVILVVSR